MKEVSIFSYVEQHAEEIIQSQTKGHEDHWKQFVSEHPADIAECLSEMSERHFSRFFVLLPPEVQVAVFSHLSDTLMVFTLGFLTGKQRAYLLHHIPLDELTDLFERLSDEELQQYLPLLNKQDRSKVLALMEFDPESAGGIMETDVLSFIKDFTVEKAVYILQRLQPRLELHHTIFVTTQENKLVGHIKLEDLVLHSPQARLSTFMRRNPLVIKDNEDREEIVHEMRHYELTIAPVVSEEDYFLGVISSEQLIEIVEQEAREDVHKMSAMPAIKYPYFETSFGMLLFQRSGILVVLLLAQSFSSMILEHYEALLSGFLMYFITMLISTGGNSSSQTSALVIQEMASGEINSSNMGRFLSREFRMAVVMALILGFFGFLRAYAQHANFMGSIAVSLSLSLIVLVSIMLGSLIPVLLKKMNMDPAFAAGPFLATLMDILGLMIYCGISSIILS